MVAGARRTGIVDSQRRRAFDLLLAEHKYRLFTYIVSLVPNWNDADEVFQETSLRMWQDFARFEAGTDFVAWACRVAYFQVLTYRKRKQRDRLEFSQQFVDAVAEGPVPPADGTQRLQAALRECLGKLRAEHRALVELRYAPGATIANVAAHTGRSVEATYKAVARIRKLLHDCIQQRGARP